MNKYIAKYVSAGLLAIAMALPLTSCSDDDDMTNDVPGTSELIVMNDVSTFNFRYNDETSQTLAFSTNQCWRIAVEDESLSWIRFSKISGKEGDNQSVTIEVDPLTPESPDARTTSFKLIAGDKEETFNVLQSQMDAIVIPHPEQYQNLVYNEQTIDVDVVTNVDDYTVDIAYAQEGPEGWLSVIQSKATHEEKIHLHVAANLARTGREATLTIKSNSSDASTSVKIAQEGKPDPMIQITNKSEFTEILNKAGGEYIIMNRYDAIVYAYSKNVLINDDMEAFMPHLKAFYDKFPYTIINNNERHYQAVIFTIFTMLGEDVKVEHTTSDGRIDLVLKTDKSIFIFELKYKKSADIAMAQISDKNYAKAFADDGRKVVKVGINFSENQRSIEDWVIE